MDEKRSIPLEIKREVRQRCGFGCVICGCPIYEYDHMMDWAIYKRHIASEITLLCAQHHSEKTSGLLPIKKVLKANQKPHNLQNGISKPYPLHFHGNQAHIGFGDDEITIQDPDAPFSQVILFLVYNFPLFECFIKDNFLNISLILFDKQGNLILQIVENELTVKPDNYDVYFKSNRLIVNERKKKILMEIEFNPPNKIIIRKGLFYYKNIEIKISKLGIRITNLINGSKANARFSNTGFRFNSLVLIQVGKSDFPGITFIKMGDEFNEING